MCSPTELNFQVVLKAIADATTLMPQDPEIFSDTIGFNLTFGLEVDENEIREAIRLARFEPVLKRLPNGLEDEHRRKKVSTFQAVRSRDWRLQEVSSSQETAR